MDNFKVSQKQIKSEKYWKTKFKLWLKPNQIFYIEEESFETLYIVKVSMNNDNNEFKNDLKKKH